MAEFLSGGVLMGRRMHGDGSLYYIESRDRWAAQVTYTDPTTGKRKSATRTAKTKKAAALLLRALTADRDAGLLAGSQDTSEHPRVSDVLRSYQEAKTADWAPSTVLWAKRLTGKHLAPLGNVYADQLTAARVSKLLRRLADDGLGAATIRQVRRLLAASFRRAIATGEVAPKFGVNPADAGVVTVPRTKQQERASRALSVDEVRSLTAAASGHRLGAAVVVEVYTGLRPSEVRALQWEDVDLDTGTLRVRHGMSTDDEGRPVLAAPKTAKSTRALSVPTAVVDALTVHRKLQREEADLAGGLWSEEWNGLVFRSEAGTPVDSANLRRLLRRLADDAGLTGSLTPYDLRHTAASLMIDGGAPVDVVQDVLGHSDSRMLDLHYRHRLTPTVAVPDVLG